MSREPFLLAGTVPTAWILFGSRWISFAGAPPLFVTDLLVIGSVLAWVLRGIAMRGVSRRFQVSSLQMLIVVFLSWTLFRLATSDGFPSMIALRDAAPYAYALLAVICTASLRRASATTIERTLRLVRVALVGHLLWCTFVATHLVTPRSLPTWPGGTNRLLDVRTDIDMAILGITAAVYLWRAVTQRSSGLPVLVAITSMGVGLAFYSRAGLLGLVTAVTVGILLAVSMPLPHKTQAVLVLAAPLTLSAVAVVLPTTESGQRMLATVGASEQSTAQAEGAVGTAAARQQAWDRVKVYSSDEPKRRVAGVGFGPNFLRDSGAEVLLAGTDYQDVRSPHNMFLGVLLRLGLIGLTVFAGAILLGGVLVVRRRRTLAQNELYVMAAASVAAVSMVSSLGVVLEAPFGAIPFWWSLGILACVPGPRTSNGQPEGASTSISHKPLAACSTRRR